MQLVLNELHLHTSRYRSQCALHQGYARNQRAIRPFQKVRPPPRDLLHQRLPAPAGAGTVARHTHVSDAVADQRHTAIDEIGHYDVRVLTGIGVRAVLAQEFDHDVIQVQMHSVVLLAFASDQPDLLATVTVGDPAAEHLLNELPLRSEEHHGRRNNALGPQIADVQILQILGQDINGVRVPEDHSWLRTPPLLYKSPHAEIVNIHRIQVDAPVKQQLAQLLLSR